MYIAMVIVVYLGFALLVGRFCSLNSRWERAVGDLMEEEVLRAQATATAEASAFMDLDVRGVSMRSSTPSQAAGSAAPPLAAKGGVESPNREEAARPVEVG